MCALLVRAFDPRYVFFYLCRHVTYGAVGAAEVNTVSGSSEDVGGRFFVHTDHTEPS